jgi:hypothetical protein
MGAYDAPKPFAVQSIPCRMLMISDRPQHPSSHWEVSIHPGGPGTPRLQAKYPKLFPWAYSDDGPWIWIDGSMEIQSETFAEEALDAVETVGMWTHPARDCLYQEAAFSTTLPKYQGQPLAEQADHYVGEGMPRHWGLWAAGLIVYKHRTLLTATWMREIEKWGIQDQVSLPYAAWVENIRPEPLPYHLLDNPWVHLHFHHDGTS